MYYPCFGSPFVLDCCFGGHPSLPSLPPSQMFSHLIIVFDGDVCVSSYPPWCSRIQKAQYKKSTTSPHPSFVYHHKMFFFQPTNRKLRKCDLGHSVMLGAIFIYSFPNRLAQCQGQDIFTVWAVWAPDVYQARYIQNIPGKVN